MRATSHARMQGDPADVAAHNLHDQDAVVRFRRGVQAVNRVRCHRHRGVKAEGVVRRGHVIVNGLRHTDYRNAVVCQPLCTFERAFAADGDKGVHLSVCKIGLDLVNACLELVGVEAAGAQDGAAA